jgi:hypothetical protein
VFKAARYLKPDALGKKPDALGRAVKLVQNGAAQRTQKRLTRYTQGA